ncbi:hypothetical protein [Mammaliicoccus lentus]|uniref:hypothetical protein n=1 Tax=Mammaliicoccus lentus TaxID=42858 RepID=UPI003CFB0C94
MNSLLYSLRSLLIKRPPTFLILTILLFKEVVQLSVDGPERIPEGEWTTCQSNKECDDLKNDLSEYEFEEDSLFDFIEGTYIVTKAEPISWYWLEFEDTLSRDQQLVKVRVK